jgi:hypothetical protein
MMIGELDFMDLFFNEDPEEDVPYEGVSYAIFLIFVTFVSIIIMNLLVRSIFSRISPYRIGL